MNKLLTIAAACVALLGNAAFAPSKRANFNL